jgi:hypothetical protein
VPVDGKDEDGKNEDAAQEEDEDATPASGCGNFGAAGENLEDATISATACLCELPTTQVTPGNAAISSGARCA